MYWKTLEHGGPAFPAAYKVQHIPLVYNGKAFRLSKTAEHYALMYAKCNDKYKDATFNANFFRSWKPHLPQEIEALDACDFAHFAAAPEQPKRAVSDRLKYCKLDGETTPMESYMIEPPCIFKGRGDHPLRGTVKGAVSPCDVVVNGTRINSRHAWKAVVTDPTKRWFASYTDSLGKTHYLFPCSANSAAKFDVARRCKRRLGAVRSAAEGLLHSDRGRDVQIGCVVMLVLMLGIRAGHGTHDDGAQTMGCCTLDSRCFAFLPAGRVSLRFVGKDSIVYSNTFACPPLLYAKLKELCAKRGVAFDLICAPSVNSWLKRFHPDMSAKVIRTCKACTTFQRALRSERIADPIQRYKSALLKVARLCNHVRNETFTGDTAKMNYLDPRITFSYAKRHSIDIDRLLSRALQARFDWASACGDSWSF